MKKNWVVYHLKSLDYAKRKVEVKQVEINEELRETKNKSKALKETRNLLDWYKKQVDYHRLELIKHLEPTDRKTITAIIRRDRENKSLERTFLTAREFDQTDKG